MTQFRVVTKTVYVTTQYGGKTVTVTKYIPGGRTVYDTQTFTLPIVVTKKTTATITAPTTITKVVTKEATREIVVMEVVEKILKETPLWVWLLIGVLGFLTIVLMAMSFLGVRARFKPRSRSRRRR